MSNEYKDWCWDTAQECILNNEYVQSIDYFTAWEDGYLALCTGIYGDKIMYFIWLDDIDGWSYRTVK